MSITSEDIQKWVDEGVDPADTNRKFWDRRPKARALFDKLIRQKSESERKQNNARWVEHLNQLDLDIYERWIADGRSPEQIRPLFESQAEIEGRVFNPRRKS